MPVDARLASEDDAGLGLALHLLEHQREGHAFEVGIILLDACRDNPLARNLARTMGTRSSLIGQGLAEVRTGAELRPTPSVATFPGWAEKPISVPTPNCRIRRSMARLLRSHPSNTSKPRRLNAAAMSGGS